MMARHTHITTKCLHCNAEFKTTVERQRNGHGKYCSKRCLYASMSKIKIITCIVCGRVRRLLSKQFGKRDGHFCSSVCCGIYHSGAKHHMWNGGVYKKTGTDYLMQYDPVTRTHQRLHRRIMEVYLGRKLGKEEIVHHKNGNALDNQLVNLEVMSRADHIRVHDPRNWQNRKDKT